MGYRGKGLGKDENGREEALTAESIKVDLTNQKQTKPDTLIFSSSIMKGINENGFNKGYKGKNAKLHKFHGRTAREIKSYIPVNLKEQPQTVVIAASGNGVPTCVNCSTPLEHSLTFISRSTFVRACHSR